MKRKKKQEAMTIELSFSFILVVVFMEYGEWEGGHLAGCITRTPWAWNVMFTSPDHTEPFKFRLYPSEDAAHEAAVAYRNDEAKRRKPRNRYRRVRDPSNGDEWLEMEVTQEYSTLVDESDIQDLQPITWTSLIRSTSDVVYTHGWFPDQGRHISMHDFLMGATGVHHINGDGLDNRRRTQRLLVFNVTLALGNLKVLSQALNCKERRICKRSKSGISGVWYVKGSKAWQASWQEPGGRKTKTYTISAHGDPGAYNKAVAKRTEKAAEFGYVTIPEIPERPGGPRKRKLRHEQNPDAEEPGAKQPRLE